ncbi:hypothetical protein A9Q87_09965 [Flavobacteriales bacterium 34_180_T64]|nr:hypothetical protein A9Q87_09965 [Flavobacteriales bacterium 34_180_T64]
MNTNISYKRAFTNEELHQILELQRINLPQGLSNSEKDKEGFVTVHHSFELLKSMNDKCAHVIAKHNSKVVGYALCMLQEFQKEIPVLVSMFNEIDKELRIQNKEKLSYLTMGQICIDKSYRKLGIFRGLYEFMRAELNATFNMIITEVDGENIRSIDAHKAIGFEVLKTYTSNDRNWELIIWNWA